VLGAFDATQLELAKCAALLAVAKDGFDQLANDLTHGIAGMASGARIDRTGAMLGVLCDLGRHSDGSAVGDEGGAVSTTSPLRFSISA
jgi:hypothetical protein